MDERLLHFIWLYQRFDSANLRTFDGERLVVFDPGKLNDNSGPDFEEARLKIGAIEWAGSVEIHIQSSDWNLHRHSNNPAYHSVILHVVWEHNEEISLYGQAIPTIELKNLVDPELINQYKKHLSAIEVIACKSQHSAILDLSYTSMIDRMAVDRLQGKANVLLHMHDAQKHDWDEVCYQALVQNFGFSVNKRAFEQLGQVLSFNLLKKNLSSLSKTEALLFGQAGFLGNDQDPYEKILGQEFSYLRMKYELNVKMERHAWKFGRMRPANFPTLRLAQLAGLLHSESRFFSQIIDANTTEEITGLLNFRLSDYWRTHYDFGKKRAAPIQAIGAKSIESILINTIAPILAAYSKLMNDQLYLDRAVQLLETIAPEHNKITKEWSDMGKKAKSAFESQGQIQLFNTFCKKRKCLSCAVGVSLLNE